MTTLIFDLDIDVLEEIASGRSYRMQLNLEKAERLAIRGALLAIRQDFLRTVEMTLEHGSYLNDLERAELEKFRDTLKRSTRWGTLPKAARKVPAEVKKQQNRDRVRKHRALTKEAEAAGMPLWKYQSEKRNSHI